MDQPADQGKEVLTLTPAHRMLIQMRDTLYEGSWDDFCRDLKARICGEPYVFEIVQASPRMKHTIEDHLVMIDQMRAWEARHARPLTPEDVI